MFYVIVNLSVFVCDEMPSQTYIAKFDWKWMTHCKRRKGFIWKEIKSEFIDTDIDTIFIVDCLKDLTAEVSVNISHS